LKIYNLLGQEIVTLLDEVRERGVHSPIQWNGLDKNGKAVPAGIYFVQLSAQGFSQSKKMILLR
jgi:flagellar hook assembly protein FlgD